VYSSRPLGDDGRPDMRSAWLAMGRVPWPTESVTMLAGAVSARWLWWLRRMGRALRLVQVRSVNDRIHDESLHKVRRRCPGPQDTKHRTPDHRWMGERRAGSCNPGPSRFDTIRFVNNPSRCGRSIIPVAPAVARPRLVLLAHRLSRRSARYRASPVLESDTSGCGKESYKAFR